MPGVIFVPDVMMDAKLFYADRRGKLIGFWNQAQELGFTSLDAAKARAKWFEEQPVEYQQQVMDEIEKYLKESGVPR